jgi:hypothetical protein
LRKGVEFPVRPYYYCPNITSFSVAFLFSIILFNSPASVHPVKSKGDYTIAKTWRPISLLSTLGKVPESVVAESILFAVDAFGLLPTNHFGARKRRSAEQALMLLQEYIYKAWRPRLVVSLISFDVKGPYNGICKERLLQRLEARDIPQRLLHWIDTFCLKRIASFELNGQSSELKIYHKLDFPKDISITNPVLLLLCRPGAAPDWQEGRIDRIHR